MFKKINIFESALAMNERKITTEELLQRASIEQIRNWQNEIKADERNALNSAADAEFNRNADDIDLQMEYEKWRQSENDKYILRMLTLAGIQKQANMTDKQFLEIGKRAVNDARRLSKIRKRRQYGK